MTGRRFGAVAVLTLVVWLGVALVVAPLVIRQGYAGSGFALLDGIFAGRDVHPVDLYLDAWRSVALALTAVLAVGLPVLAVWTLRPEWRRDALHRLLGGAADLAPGAIVRLTVLAGMLGGLSEAVYAAVRQAVTDRPAANFHWEVVWMAPISAALAAAVPALLVAALARAARGGMSVDRAGLIAGFLVVFPVVRSEGIALHPAAEVVLALGLATVVARVAAANHGAVRRVVRLAAPAVAAGVVLLAGFAWSIHPRILEARALRDAPAPTPGLPNILLIILDTTRAASFSLYGYDRPTSPELDAWAGSGTVFERAIAPSSWTLPSHATLFTGLHNHDLGTGVSRSLADEFRTLAEVLVEHGFATAGFAANPSYTTSASGLAQGFARWEDRPWDAANFVRSSWLASGLLGRPLGAVDARLVPRTPRAPDVTAGFLEWLAERDEERPFFVFLNYFDAHEPYFAPPGWVERFGEAPSGSWSAFTERFPNTAGTRVRPEGIDRWINRYDASIAWIDHHVGLIRDRLAEEGLLEETLVIVASDHGEMWGEKGHLGHGVSLYVPLIHVPLVIALPGAVPEGLRVDRPVGLQDIPRTVGDLTGIEELARFPGRSLVDQWRPTEAGRPRYVLAELAADDDERWWVPRARGPMKSLVSETHQYILNGDGAEELYDLGADYAERRDLARDPAAETVLVRLRAVLDSMVPARRTGSEANAGERR